jgi:putative tricarboxylic transport membrane protein
MNGRNSQHMHGPSPFEARPSGEHLRVTDQTKAAWRIPHGGEAPHRPRGHRRRGLAGLLLLLAAVVYWDAAGLQLNPVYGLGPKAMPIVVAAGLVLLAVGNLVMGLRGDLPPREPSDLKAIALILGGLIALIACIGIGGGFIPAIAMLFAATSAAFGRKAPLTDIAIGLALGAVVYLAFDKLLTLSLPAGPLERLL